MDEALAFSSVDISGRPFLVFDASFPEESIGGYDSCMTEEFFRALAFQAGITLHLKCEYGKNSHHMTEAVYKAAAHALKAAVQETGAGCYPPKEFYKEKKCMILLPAIDIKDGTCVRLQKGDYQTAHKVAENPLETALSFQKAGAEWIHMVDLDGAKDAVMVNQKIFLEIAQKTNLRVELGGGIRNMETVDYYLQNGISRVILGSAAVKNPRFVERAVGKYRDQIAVGIDARNEMVAAEGWLDTSNVHYLDLAKKWNKSV